MTDETRCVAVLTSGGDAPGMNAALRAVVRSGLEAGVRVFAVLDGLRGLIEGEKHIQEMDWDSVGGILHRGGTVIGTARCREFFEVEGRQRAVETMVHHGIDRLIVIGGDGSLTAADLLRREWADHLRALTDKGAITTEQARRHSFLALAGLVGSIDNDMFGTDMTIGADTALHRITRAVDDIGSTASSHQRTFVVEVMGRNCGYLAVMSALATGADWFVIPERPPAGDQWRDEMVQRLRAGRAAGRRDSIVIIAEGARDAEGRPITASDLKNLLQEELKEEVRVTILGHVQRGGSPSAFDRTMSTLLGHGAVREVLAAKPGDDALLIGLKNNRIQHAPLAACVAQNRKVAQAVEEGEFDQAMALRGTGFSESVATLNTLLRSIPRPPQPGQKRLRLAVLTAGPPAPGMNTAARAAVRLGLDQGHVMIGVTNGFAGLVKGEFSELGWMSVSGWTSAGGSELGANRHVPTGTDFYSIARGIEEQRIDGILVIGGWSAYVATHALFSHRDAFPAFDVPIVVLPASINNNLPGSELSIGADTALNSIVEVVDKIKQSAVASRRCFVVEVMGRYCGYLALMAGIATGAERVYIHEEGVTLSDLQKDVQYLISGFKQGKKLGLMIRNERANHCYSTQFMVNLFEEESGDLFEVRQAILGHLQQGGSPSPFDRIQATRLARQCIDRLVSEAGAGTAAAVSIGVREGRVVFNDIEELPKLADAVHQRPKTQWWMDLRPIARVLAQPGPGVALNGLGAAD
jgi:6-phosphofructokinase 1